jgi:cytochrome b6-f complex iron-sulfur subunit
MNRREFIRSAIATTTLLAVGLTGMFEVVSKAETGQSNSQQVQLPPITSDAGQSSTASSASAPSQAPSSSSQSASASTQSSASSSQASSASSQASSTTLQSSSSSSQSSSAPAPAGYVLVAQLSSLSGKSSAYFNHPTHGNSILLSLNGQWMAFSATCTHRPCTVDFQSSELYCPCHGATFSASNGSVTRGPAPTKLAEYGVIVQNGGVYVSNSATN